MGCDLSQEGEIEMAVFNTNETKEMIKQYRRFMNEAFHQQVHMFMGNSDILEEKHIDMFEAKINKYYSYIKNINELPYKEKIELIWKDIFDCIEVVFDKYQNKDLSFSVELKEIEREVAMVLTPMIFYDLFYYTKELKNYRKQGSKSNIKTPADVVNELEEKLRSGKYIPKFS